MGTLSAKGYGEVYVKVRLADFLACSLPCIGPQLLACTSAYPFTTERTRTLSLVQLTLAVKG